MSFIIAPKTFRPGFRVVFWLLLGLLCKVISRISSQRHTSSVAHYLSNRFNFTVVFATGSFRRVTHGHSSVLVRVDTLAEVDGVLQLFLENSLTRVPGHLEQEEAGVALRKEVIRRIVLVQYLQDKVPPTEVCDGSREARSTPHEPQE